MHILKQDLLLSEAWRGFVKFMSNIGSVYVYIDII